VQSWVQCKDIGNELKWAIEGAELEKYRFVEAEHTKWEAREMRLVAELETALPPCDVLSDKAQESLSLHSSCNFLNNLLPVQMFTVVDTLTLQNNLMFTVSTV